MRGHRTRAAAAALVALALLGSACSSRDDDDATTSGDESESEGAAESSIDTADCIDDPTVPIEGDTVKLVSSYPQSGATAAFAEIARGWESYFEKVNDEGGVEIAGESYQIEYEDMDDEYNPAETAANLDEMVPAGSDVFAVFSVVGTANNLAIRDQLGELCVPNVFAATGSPAWGNEDYPWTLGSSLSPYPLEGSMFASLLEDEKPDATVAMLVQDDDFGRAYEEGFAQAIEGTDIEVVKVERYQTGSADVSAQITSLADTDADAFFNGGTLLACPDALSRAKEAGWEPITWVSTTCTSQTLMGIAQDAGDGVYSAGNLKDPLNPDWDEDEAMVEYLDTVRQYRPEGFLETNAIVGYGYTQAAIFIEALEAAEEPTRLALMESVRNLEVSDAGLLLPGVTVSTSEGDPYFGETLQLLQYEFTGPDDRNHFVPTGDLVDFEGETVEVTPEDLING
ncbi:MAG TPA: ABC transporter substrate-binding protein [Acidimicrobiales bacterium]|nr:ABC transporter substrate-binding protein [Acidimicrobiales bacterium]